MKGKCMHLNPCVQAGLCQIGVKTRAPRIRIWYIKRGRIKLI